LIILLFPLPVKKNTLGGQQGRDHKYLNFYSPSGVPADNLKITSAATCALCQILGEAARPALHAAVVHHIGVAMRLIPASQPGECLVVFSLPSPDAIEPFLLDNPFPFGYVFVATALKDLGKNSVLVANRVRAITRFATVDHDGLILVGAIEPVPADVLRARPAT
jgi:hypothetical protein